VFWFKRPKAAPMRIECPTVGRLDGGESGGGGPSRGWLSRQVCADCLGRAEMAGQLAETLGVVHLTLRPDLRNHETAAAPLFVRRTSGDLWRAKWISTIPGEAARRATVAGQSVALKGVLSGYVSPIDISPLSVAGASFEGLRAYGTGPKLADIAGGWPIIADTPDVVVLVDSLGFNAAGGPARGAPGAQNSAGQYLIGAKSGRRDGRAKTLAGDGGITLLCMHEIEAPVLRTVLNLKRRCRQPGPVTSPVGRGATRFRKAHRHFRTSPGGARAGLRRAKRRSSAFAPALVEAHDHQGFRSVAPKSHCAGRERRGAIRGIAFPDVGDCGNRCSTDASERV